MLSLTFRNLITQAGALEVRFTTRGDVESRTSEVFLHLAFELIQVNFFKDAGNTPQAGTRAPKQAEASEIEPQPMTDEKGDIRGMQTTSPPSTGLIRLGAAARMAGLTPEAMRAALARNEIPVSRLTIGKLTFLRASELHIWLTAPTPSPAAADLFR